MSEATAALVDYIRRNRVSSTEVADALGKTGALPGMTAVTRGHFRVGVVEWIYAYEESNWPVHEQIQDIPEASIVLIEAFDCAGRAIFGDIVAKYMLLYRQASALVVQGALRDAHRLIKEGWPIWCTGFNPVGCFNRKPSAPLDPAVVKQRQETRQGAIAVCDDTGVVVIPPDRHNEEFLERLQFIEEQEDIWYECIDRKKWSTFRTICLKDYESKE
ncbi:MAG: RraA family protein [Gemmatimonadetes bacterium]|nr:RraA family protein [Gemmatimonadota bacterium]